MLFLFFLETEGKNIVLNADTSKLSSTCSPTDKRSKGKLKIGVDSVSSRNRREKKSLVRSELGHLAGVELMVPGSSSSALIMVLACHFENPSRRASCIHGCLHFSRASGMVSHLLWRMLCSGHELSSSVTCIANIAALHRPSGQNSS